MRNAGIVMHYWQNNMFQEKKNAIQFEQIYWIALPKNSIALCVIFYEMSFAHECVNNTIQWTFFVCITLFVFLISVAQRKPS